MNIKVASTVAYRTDAWRELLLLVLALICKQVAYWLLEVLIVALAVVHISITVDVYVVLAGIALPKMEVDLWIQVHVRKRHLLLRAICILNREEVSLVLCQDYQLLILI